MFNKTSIPPEVTQAPARLLQRLGHTFDHNQGSVKDSIAFTELHLLSIHVSGLWLRMQYFLSCPRKKKHIALRSGNRGGQETCRFLPIQRPGNTSSTLACSATNERDVPTVQEPRVLSNDEAHLSTVRNVIRASNT